MVDENNLPAQVASLRRILGAGAIRTVPGFGYRLELAVSRSEAVADGPAAARSETAAVHEQAAAKEQAASNGPAVADVQAVPKPEPPRLAVPRRTWPNRLGSLVGRDGEVRDLLDAIDRACLVTIVGVAGVGKTRLAREILDIINAAHFTRSRSSGRFFDPRRDIPARKLRLEFRKRQKSHAWIRPGSKDLASSQATSDEREG